MAPTITGLKVLKRCIQYLASHPHLKLYTYNYYDGSNFIRITWSGTQFEYYTIYNDLECHQGVDRYIIISMRRSILGIIHTLLGVTILKKVKIKPAVSYVSTDEEKR